MNGRGKESMGRKNHSPSVLEESIDSSIHEFVP